MEEGDALEVETVSATLVDAQREAEMEVEQNEIAVYIDPDAPLAVPKLLQPELGIAEMAEKTNLLKQRGEQLDLLLIKAESYSHFIKSNQELAQQARSVQPPSKTKTPVGKKSKRLCKGAGKDEEEAEESLQPSNLKGGSLLPYQLDGLQWLASLWENGLSGILADEMGLGKTIQVIALVAHLRQRNVLGPFLIAAPLATLPNWLNEFQKWLPSCPCMLYHGSKPEREELRKTMDQHAAIITSFEICIVDRPHLERTSWQFLIVDEGHRIKNRNCRLVKELKMYPTVSRLLLTGTPIQNNLEELWSLLNFVNPAIFDDLEVFQSWFGFRNIGKDTKVDDIIGTERQERVVSKLHEILRPFLLRRMKKDVLINMPPKREIIVYCGMSSLQRDYYDRVLQNTLRDTLISMELEGASTISQMNPTMNLRKVCNHPFLFGEPRETSGEFIGDSKPQLMMMASGKFKLLDRMLPRLRKGDHKVLIFSQMTKLMDILQDYLHWKEYQCCRLDGSTPLDERRRLISSFNNDKDSFIFLLSTRSGGQGINLAAADTVILFDSDYNPHMDAQAEARCHRIGQQRPVITYRLLTAGSVEIEMMEKQISKKKLERLTIHGGDFRKAGERSGNNLTLSRLRELLEDDVKNLDRNSRSGADISEEELDVIMDRDSIFRSWDSLVSVEADVDADPSNNKKRKSSPSSVMMGPSHVPIMEGKMYDIVVVDESLSLGGVN